MTILRLRCVILEDEDDIRGWLVSKLQQYSELEIVGTATTVDEGFQLIVSEKPDVAFMDVHLIGGNAFALLSRLKDNAIPIPFIVMATGYPDYVMKALNEYRQYIVQYLVKPFVENWQDKFRKAIDALISAKLKSLNKKEDTESVKVKPENKEESYIFLQNKGSLIRLDFNKIDYLEAAGSGQSIVVMNDNILQVDMTLSKFIEFLPNYFVRISRTNIINIDRVVTINRRERTVKIMVSEKCKSLGISNSFYSDFLDFLPRTKDRLKE